MKRYLFYVLVGLFLNINDIHCQLRQQRIKDFEEGQYFFNRNEYEDALLFYLKLLEDDTLQANYNFKAGECYLNIPGREHFAVKYLERAVKKVVPKKEYDKKAFEERNAPLHAYFYLGNAYRMADQLDKALEAYEKFLNSPYFFGNYNQNVVENEIKSCERAKIIQDAPLNFQKVYLGKNINSDNADLNPVVSGNGKSVAFIRQLKFYNAVFYSVYDSSGWLPAININPWILSDGDFFPTGFSYNGDQMLLVKKGAEDQDIYISKLENGKWSEATKLNNEINSFSNETFASFGADNKSIYFSSDRHGGKGGFDIYMSKLMGNGQWGAPKNLGKTINTEFDEQNPIIIDSNNILFFCSNGHYNMGGYDIFYSNFEGKKWNTPINIGYPLNDTRNNMWFYPVGKGREGYCSFEEGNSYGQSDIFYIKILSTGVLNFDENEK
jgi:tetratricopeptide (TPR) repeat protein